MTEPVRPMLRVVRGNPSAEDVAALVAVLASRAGAAPAAVARPLWQDRAAVLRAPLMPRRGAWRASGQPTHR